MIDPRFFRRYLDILNEGPPPGIGPNAAIKPTTPAPINVPQGWEAKTQPDGSTRISKIGSMSREQYRKNMADYAAKYDSPEYIKYHQDKMASGGFSDEEKLANYKEQEKYFGRADPAILDTLKQQPAQKSSVGGTSTTPAVNEAPQTTQPNDPSQFQQAKDAVGQQYQNYKDISGQLDQGVQQGLISKDVADKTRSFAQGSMLRGGYEAGKAALQGRDPSTAYVGSLIRSQGELAANSGLDTAMKKIGSEVGQYRGPNAKDIRNDPSFKKASPDQQAQAIKNQETLRNMSDDDYAYYTSGNAVKQAGQAAIQAGQDMIDQKDWGKGPSSGYSPETNKLFGLDPTRQATDAEFDAAAKGTNEELDRLKQLIRK